MRGFFGVLFLAVVALVAGLVGYQIGITSHAVDGGGTVYVGGGFPGFGTLLFLLFIGFLFFGIAGRGRGHWGHGHDHWGAGYGRRGWGGGPWGGPMGPGGPGDQSGQGGNPGSAAWTDPRRQWVADMHRQLHADDAPGAGGTNANAGTTGGTGTTPGTGTTS